MKYLLSVLSVFSVCAGAFAQHTLTEPEAVALAVRNSASFNASALQTRQSREQQRSAFSLLNPDVVAESPTGEFYAVGVLQTFDFPTVYGSQVRLARQQTRLAEKQQAISENEVRRTARTLYLTLQYNQSLLAQLRLQDSLYNQLRLSATRQFEAGQIDYLAKTFAETQYGELHNQLIQAAADHRIADRQLGMLTGRADSIAVADLQRATSLSGPVSGADPDTGFFAANTILGYLQQSQQVSRNLLQLERNRILPGLVAGYLNQGPRETPTRYRFRFGITLPVYFWQYGSRIRAAKTGVEIARQETAARKQSLTADMTQAQGNLSKFGQSLQYYESTGLQKADEIINSARRFFESGQNDYAVFLRYTNDAYAIKVRYLETLRGYNQALIDINYLNGN